MINRIRKGFATNSSSSHSIVLVKNEKIDDDCSNSEDLEYGWEKFTLSTYRSKKWYFLTAYLQQVGKLYDEGFIKKWLDLTDEDLDYINDQVRNDSFYGIDHQSRFLYPVDDSGHPHREFLMALKDEVIKNPKVVVFGGNDNDDNDLPSYIQLAKNNHPLLEALVDEGRDSTYKISKGNNYWVLFNTSTGDKIHFGGDGVVEKADFPELVDLKITDRCDCHCNYCYQGSTPNGKIADYKDIDDLIFAFKEMGVLEVALGGGDPLTYPKFNLLLKKFRANRIIPNFSTKDYEELVTNKNFKSIIENSGAIGISVSNFYELKTAYHLLFSACYLAELDERYFRQKNINKIVFQVIPGIIWPADVENIIEYMRHNTFKVLFLGPKFKGRASSLDKSNTLSRVKETIPYIISGIKEYPGMISVDTSLANLMEKDLNKIKADKRTYYTEEGKFSMYVDAVNKTCGSCSFADKYADFPEKNTYIYHSQLAKFLMSEFKKY
jgi:hypothetical protein